MKIKSITDVITNSSSEVFIVKTSDLEEAKKEIYDKSWKKKRFHYELENIFDLFKSINTLDDISKEDLNNFVEDPYRLVHLIVPFKLTSREIRILKDLNFTDEEIKEYEDKKDKERLELRNSNEELKKILGMSIARAYDHDWIGTYSALYKWLKEHNKEFYHDIS